MKQTIKNPGNIWNLLLNHLQSCHSITGSWPLNMLCPSLSAQACFILLYHLATLVLLSISWNASQPSMALSTPYTAKSAKSEIESRHTYEIFRGNKVKLPRSKRERHQIVFALFQNHIKYLLSTNRWISKKEPTLVCQKDVHARLAIFEKKFPLHVYFPAFLLVFALQVY